GGDKTPWQENSPKIGCRPHREGCLACYFRLRRRAPAPSLVTHCLLKTAKFGGLVGNALSGPTSLNYFDFYLRVYMGSDPLSIISQGKKSQPAIFYTRDIPSRTASNRS